MTGNNEGSARAETDASLHSERQNTDQELGNHVATEDADAERVLRLARDRADRLLNAARTAADVRLPLSEQTEAAVALLLRQREEEDDVLTAERQQTQALLESARRDQRDKISALLVLERQTTDLHLALERRSADHAVSSREDFLAQASHDLRGLMAAHRIYVSLLVKEATDGEDRPRLAPHLAMLTKIEGQMERMVSDLVDIAAIEAGRLALAPRAYSAAELLLTAAAVFEPVAQECGQSLSVAPTPVDASVLVDPVRATQVLGNLLSNAIKFTPRGGVIRVGFETATDEVLFFVADTGPGVPAEQAARIFQRFVASGPKAGLGLGLYISERLIDAHGGRIWLDSEAEGGAVFRFTVQRALPGRAARSAAVQR